MRRELFDYVVRRQLAFDILEGKLAEGLKVQLKVVRIQFLAAKPARSVEKSTHRTSKGIDTLR